MLAWQQLETKATVVRERSAVLHAAVGEGKLPFCTDAAKAMAGVNLINFFQAVNGSIKYVVDENVRSVLTLIYVLEWKHDFTKGMECKLTRLLNTSQML